MEIYKAIIFGITQGLTEFLPISSSGHLVILHDLIPIPAINDLAFDVVLHLATALAVIWFFKKEIIVLIKAWFKSLRGDRSVYARLSWLIILGTIPASIAGFFFEDITESVLRTPLVVAVMLILVGILFIVFEKISKFQFEVKELNWKKSLIIGVTQALALIPGTSRSGITIIAGMGAGLKREAALKFSFLLSIPIILGASIKKIPPLFSYKYSGNELSILFFAFIFSYIAGFFAIKYFLEFSRKHSLNIFAYYRFILAAFLLFYFFWPK